MQKKTKRKPLVPSRKLVNTVLILGVAIAACAIVYDDYRYKQWLEEKRQREAEEQLRLSVEYDERQKMMQGYELVWNDEFDGTSLDLTKWDYQCGTGAEYGLDGWGDFELEYNTDRPENVRVEDGKLKITAIREETPYGGMEYTSGRIRTVTAEGEDLFSITYGRIDIRVKMPYGEGLHPAFWMLPVNEDIYGGGASSGEIDIIEARGSDKRRVEGNLHYGREWPNETSQGGSCTFVKGTDITDYHTYALEWSPGEISWYVDDRCFYTADSWFSQGEAAGTEYTSPAPFDVPFYMLLGLAVGGDFDPGAEVSPYDFPKEMEVDYVRVYQKEYSEVEEVEDTVIDRRDTQGYAKYASACADGEFIADKEFATMNTDAIRDTDTGVVEDSRDWQFAADDFGGEAVASVEELEEGSFARIDSTPGGNQTGAVQLIQHLPLIERYVYQVSFDAKASGQRKFEVSAGGEGGNRWGKYDSHEYTADAEMKSYGFTFKMSNRTDPTSRLEFDLGQAEGSMWIGNVSVKAVNANGSTNYDMKKMPLFGGNLIYNGTFDQGKARLAFWHIRDMEVCVPGSLDGVDGEKDYSRKAELTADGEEPAIYQKGLPLEADGDYFLRLDLSGAGDAVVQVTVTGADGTVYLDETCNYTGGDEEQRVKFKFSNPGEVDEENAVLTISLPQGGSVKLDNVKMNRIIC